MEKKFNLQRDTLETIVRAYNNFKKSPKDRLTEPYIQSRTSALEQLWDRFIKVHESLISEVDDWEEFQKVSYVKNNVYDKAEETYISYKADLLKQSSPVTADKRASNGNCGGHSSVKLPKIVIPTFSGKYEEWNTFRDLFISLVHSNSSLDDVQRLHYLKAHLTGEAEQLIRQLPITASNYKECWDQLDARYNNKNYLANCILKRLINQKNATVESAALLKDFADTTTDCLHALKNVGIDTTSWDVIIIYIISSKLDAETRKQWELKVAGQNQDQLPKFSIFQEFLQSRFRALEAIEPQVKPKPSILTHHKPYKPKVLHVAKMVCDFCNEDHKLYKCRSFSKEDASMRREFVFNRRLCYNCLGGNHSAKYCPSRLTCRVCNAKHHSLLHLNGSEGVGSSQGSNNDVSRNGVVTGSLSADKSAANSSAVGAAAVVSCFGQLPMKRQVFLATAIVLAESPKVGNHYIRALLDQGSQASFVTEATVQYLGIKKYPVKGIISGLGNGKTTLAKSMVNLKLHSRVDHNVVITVQAYVIKCITTFLPNCKMEEVTWLNDLCLADSQYHIPNKIDVLLGAEVYGQILQEGVRKGPRGYPLAQATSLGWIISGTCEESTSPSVNVVSMHVCVDDNEMLKRFWEMEADPKPQKKVMTEEEIACERFYSETTKRDINGRYIVKLPFNTKDPKCIYGDSRVIAEKRLNGLYLRFKKDKSLKEKYKAVIEEYLQLGFMEKIPESERNNSKAVYIPHHPVVRNDKDTTQVRLVYDASCKYKNGVSLNDSLMTGPTLQPELRHLLMRWRTHPICLAADIVKMYCQVMVSKEDVDYQRLVWKDDADAKAEDYRLLRVTFGTATAPYLAVKSLQQVAYDEGEQYPVAAEKVKKEFYMDDLLTGCGTVKEGIVIYEEISEMLKKGGFKLQKWMSNSEELLKAIKQKGEDNDTQELKIKMDEVVKLLGLTWNRRTDEFRYSVKQPEETGPVTKRKIISHVARLYDPLGWVAPCVIVAKIIIQKLWIAGLGWDEEVTGKLLDEWSTYHESLSLLTQINIPRWLGTTTNDSLVELHGFSDASKLAFSAVVYLRRVDVSGNVHVTLVTAKTKVAPIKQISIPRLELCGAVLLTRLLVEVADILAIPKSNIRAWTDSTVVLAWINSHPSRWQTFVANRVSEILTTLDTSQWAHVTSGQNAADCASRGITPAELLNNSLWFDGPEFLRLTIVPYNKSNLETQLEEVKSHFTATNVAIWSRYSSLTKLVRIVTYCRRWLNLRKSVKIERRLVSPYLTSTELAESLECCIKQCQEEHFREVFDILKRDKQFARIKGPLKSLNPFIDRKGILRVGGRLEKSPLAESAKHPMLLPKRSTFTDLVIADAHVKTLHGGIQLMMSYLSTKYYILGSKSIIKAYIRKCIKCIRHNAQTSSQLMGQLPASRVTPAKPFLCSGVDYAGPLNIRTSKGRGYHSYKGYICLFVCMATRAVHIEVVSDLTTSGFVAAFKRFIARRGRCTDIWSDNGTNFVGAARELKNLFATEKAGLLDDVAKALATDGTTWHFIPPHSPNFGGLWEAGIKSTKFHLNRVIGNITLTYEELSTVLAQIEACLNSRPLSRLESESEAINVLTPGHFLIGEPLVTAPDHNFETSNITNLRRWQLTQRILQNFWRRWSIEYISKFFHRYRWYYQNPEPNIGDIVLVKENHLPPCKWLLGRVVIKHPGIDNVTRVVTLRTKNSFIKRPTSKLCILPVAV